MRVGRLLIGLGSLLALYPSATDARTPTSIARVELEKRTELIAKWEQLADQASRGIRDFLPQPNSAVTHADVFLNANSNRALEALQSHLSTDGLEAQRALAFRALMSFLRQDFPGSEHHSFDVFLDKFRTAANAYEILSRASNIVPGQGLSYRSFGHFDSVLISQTFYRSLFSAIQTDPRFINTPEQLEPMIDGVESAVNKIHLARMVLNATYLEYLCRNRLDPILVTLKGLDKDLKLFGEFLDDQLVFVYARMAELFSPTPEAT